MRIFHNRPLAFCCFVFITAALLIYGFDLPLKIIITVILGTITVAAVLLALFQNIIIVRVPKCKTYYFVIIKCQ